MSTPTGEVALPQTPINERGEQDISPDHTAHRSRRSFFGALIGKERGWKNKLARLGVFAVGTAVAIVAVKLAYNIYQDDQAELRSNEQQEAARIAKEIESSKGSANPLSIASGPIEVAEGALMRETCVIKNNHYFLHRSNVHSKIKKGDKLTIDSPQRVVVDGSLFYSFILDNDRLDTDAGKKPSTPTSIAKKTYCIAASSLISQQNSDPSSEPLITRLEADSPAATLPDNKIVTGKRLEDGSVITSSGDTAAVGRIDPVNAAEFYQETYDFGPQS